VLARPEGGGSCGDLLSQCAKMAGRRMVSLVNQSSRWQASGFDDDYLESRNTWAKINKRRAIGAGQLPR
jgi:hypothetical protein